MTDIWWIGPGVLLLMAATALVARRSRHARPIAVGALVAGGGYALVWLVARGALRGRAGAVEAAFLQLVFAQLALFGGVVVAMIAGRRTRR